MLNRYEIENCNKKLKELMKGYQKSYQDIAERSRQEYMQKLEYGAQIPKSGVLYGEAARKEFSDKCQSYRSEMRGITATATRKLKEQLTDAPSTEAVNAISLMALRKDIPESEVLDMLDRYGNNPQAYQTIAGLAKDRGVHVDDHPVYRQLEEVEHLTNMLDNSLSLSNAERGHTSDGYLSMIGIGIDSAFPVEE